MKKKKEELSIFPFLGILGEVEKIQGNRPALIVLYTGPEDITILKHNMTFGDQFMELFMRHLTIEVLKTKGIEVSIIKKEGSN